MRDGGQASMSSMAYVHFDFRDINKQRWRDLVPSSYPTLCTLVPVVTFYYTFIPITTVARDSLMTTF